MLKLPIKEKTSNATKIIVIPFQWKSFKRNTWQLQTRNRPIQITQKMCWFQSLSFFRRTKPKTSCLVQAKVTFKRDGHLPNTKIKKLFIPHRANYSPRRCFWKKRFKIKFNWRSTRKVHGQWSTSTWSLWRWVSRWQFTIKGMVAHNDLQLILYTSDYIKSSIYFLYFDLVI